MLVLRIVLGIILINTVSSYLNNDDLEPIPNYELRRPLQYFFHLMSLKSKFNPMFGSIYSLDEECSSKAGPFCSVT